MRLRQRSLLGNNLERSDVTNDGEIITNAPIKPATCPIKPATESLKLAIAPLSQTARTAQFGAGGRFYPHSGQSVDAGKCLVRSDNRRSLSGGHLCKRYRDLHFAIS